MKTSTTSLLCLAGFVLSASAMAQKPDIPVSPTPLMGWGTWNHYRRNITEDEVKANADALVTLGLDKLGYVFVNVDGHWQGERDAQGNLHANPERFPTWDTLGDYLHAKGLKFGVYSGPGPKSCGGDNASYGHEDQDAAMFARVGADYLKYDLCTFRQYVMADLEKTQGHAAAFAAEKAAYEKMHQALRKTGRPIYFAMCQYGNDEVWKWAPEVRGTMFRTTEDVADNWLSMSEIGFSQAGLSPYIRKGFYADPDQLEVGNGGMSSDEYRLQFSLWSMVAAPLILGNDLTKIDQSTMDIITNKEVIAIDQDPLVKAGDRVWAHGQFELWARPLSGGRTAVALFNRTNGNVDLTLKLADLGWKGETAKARDVWEHKDFTITKNFTTTVKRHGVVMLVLAK
ncbi:MAG: glycoside hydrolase family 27 protein [Bryocella sp.]